MIKQELKYRMLKKPFKVEGYNQIPKDCEFANAKLIRRPSGHYIQITTFVNKSKRENTGKK